MINTFRSTNRHDHDCSQCVYYATMDYQGDSWDLYSCISESNTDYYSLIARYGSDGSEYISADMKAVYSEGHPVSVLQNFVRKARESAVTTEKEAHKSVSRDELIQDVVMVSDQYAEEAFDLGFKGAVEEIAYMVSLVDSPTFDYLARSLRRNSDALLENYRDEHGGVKS